MYLTYLQEEGLGIEVVLLGVFHLQTDALGAHLHTQHQAVIQHAQDYIQQLWYICMLLFSECTGEVQQATTADEHAPSLPVSTAQTQGIKT